MPKKPKHRTGLVSILGLPNAGKSTLLNALVGAKIAIVASKPQTTRTTVQGVWSAPEAQVVFVDTPGIHRSNTPLNKRLMSEVRNALEQRDLLLYLTDASKKLTESETQSLDMVRKSGAPVFLILNKIDKVEDKRTLLPLIESYQKVFDFAEYVPISARKGEGVENLRNLIIERMPFGPPLFASDHLTDQPERFLAAEYVREKAIRETKEEVPHALAVSIEVWEEKKTLTHIAAAIFVEREGQKGIVIGKGGEMLKRIGSLARADIEEMLGRQVHLELFVKVSENWRENPEFLNQLDWRRMAGGDSL